MITNRFLLILYMMVYIQAIEIKEIIPNSIKSEKFSLNYDHQVILIYRNIPELKTANPFRIKTFSVAAKANFPVLVVANQQKQVTAWSVPLTVDTAIKNSKAIFRNVSKILCHDDMENIVNSQFSVLPLQISQSFIISFSTSSPTSVDFTIELEEEKDFYAQLDRNYSLSISPSEPRYVFYKFDGNTSDTIVIEVNSNDEICLTISVQDSQCPVFDMNKDINYEGIHETINFKGAITLMKRKYIGGFFLVFVAKPDNFDCSQENSFLPRFSKAARIAQLNVTSNITFTIRNGITTNDYLLATLGTLIVITIIGLFLIGIEICLHRFGTMSKNKYEDIFVTDYYDTLSEGQIIQLLKTESLTLSVFARHPKRIKKKSYNYLSHTLNIALFYSIPVVQLVVTYQRIVNQTGNQDMCYYNFLCAHPAMGFSDFNHMYSNIGYIVFGMLFIFSVVDRHRIINLRKDKGIPVHYGLYHAMGVALIIEGLLSACYHICPSQSNYQFDTSFMYIMAVLCMIKLYQNRHPDINATAYTTFTVLGGAIFIATVGILNGTLAIWIIFIFCYTSLCVIISMKIYFLNYIVDGLKQVKTDIIKKGICSDTFKPVRKGTFTLLILANIANYAMLVFGICMYSKNMTDFGTFLLGLLMGNAVIHTIFYTSMKLIVREKVCLEATCYGILALCTWAASVVFFLDAATLWTVTPAESRQWNQGCLILKFYDKHDIWHLLSAPALYFTFMFLMYIDDDILDKQQDEIIVF